MTVPNSQQTGFDLDPSKPVPQLAQQPIQMIVPDQRSQQGQNMELWDKVKTTSTQFTKATSFGAMKFTAIDPQYQLQEATRLWGPYGSRWGLFDLAFTTIETSESSKDGYVATTTMTLNANFRYPGGQFPIAVDMKFRPGQDTMKKLITSARSKALSYLGFSADVFMGKFDDTAYVNDLKIREGEKNAFHEKALSSIRTAKAHEALDVMQKRIQKMVADETITGDDGAMLLDEINDRRQELIAKEMES